MAIQGNRPNNRIILFIGIVLALIVAGGVLFLTRNSTSSQPTVSVLAASQTIARNETFNSSNTQLIQVPQNLAPQGAVTNVSQVSGQVALIQLSPNQIILPSEVGSAGNVVSTESNSLANNLPPGWVLMAIPTSFSISAAPSSPFTVGNLTQDEITVGGYIQPGDHIDMLVWNGSKIIWGFQDVIIVKTTGAGGGASSSYIIEVPRAEAENMTFLTTVTNNTSCSSGCQPANPPAPTILKYVLRPACEDGDPNYNVDIKHVQPNSPAAACLHPWPNIEPNGTLNGQAPPGGDPGANNVSLGTLFGY